MRINLATQLTLLRLVLIVPFLLFINLEGLMARIAALLIFSVASITDYYDGKLARKRGLESPLGAFLDPLADKLLISAALIAFVEIRDFYVASWMVVLIIGREFLITGLRTLAVYKGRILPAQPAGKFKTTSQLVAIITVLVILVVDSALSTYGSLSPAALIQRHGYLEALGWFLQHGPYFLILMTTILTIVSGYIYINQNRDLFYG